MAGKVSSYKYLNHMSMGVIRHSQEGVGLEQPETGYSQHMWQWTSKCPTLHASPAVQRTSISINKKVRPQAILLPFTQGRTRPGPYLPG